MQKTEHILIVDDEPQICELVQTYLEREGYQVSVAEDGAAMRRILNQATVDLILLDLVMPGEDGLSLTRYIRGHSNVGIIILTGKNTTLDRIIGLEIGADDYVAKPFDLRELLARIKSVLRRTQQPQPLETDELGDIVRFAGWRLDLGSRRLLSPEGAEVPLTSGEFELLATFVKHSKRVLSRDRLLDLTHHREAGPYDRCIDVQVGRLRRKIETNPGRPELIQTVRGAGYIFTPRVQASRTKPSIEE